MPLSPMMQEYVQTKKDCGDCILMYRIGDFFEMFFDDAILVSKELELTLTGKECGLPERAPMCGVPFHAVDTYINRLIKKGYKVAICDQVEDPKLAKGLVKRAVTRVVTPGTNLDVSGQEEGRNNFLMSIVCTEDRFGLSACDVSTGEFLVTEVDKLQKLMDEINKLSPSEIICNEALLMSGLDEGDLKGRLGIMIETLNDSYFEDASCRKTLLDHFHVSSLEGLGVSGFSCGVNAAGALLSYLFETQKTDLEHISSIHPYHTEEFMVLDSSSMRNLELTETLREKEKRGSLLWVLDKTKTAMGARLLRTWIEQPLIDKDGIEKRLDAVQALNENEITCEEIREYLNPVYDLERLAGRISYKSANPRDLIALKTSLSMLPHIKELLTGLSGKRFEELRGTFDDLSDLFDMIEASLNEDPPLAMKEGGIIKDGYNEDVDGYRQAKTEGKSWLADLEAEEREKTGIHTLKIKFNHVFGYCIEVTNSFKDQVPDYFVRRQTLVGGERYTTPRLKELEDKILGAEDKLCALEYELYSKVRDEIGNNIVRIQKTAKIVAEIDVCASLSDVARHNRYVRPSLNKNGVINIKDGRHPVVEKMIDNEGFVPNDTFLDNKNRRISIITGPNMAGKSTYMRQTALIVLMAQIGSFVPAKSADIGIVDRIFTRVGASDDLASGQSTFMVEMTEVANILRNATQDSLLILDEIGRGTSTFDGLSIAWAVVEYIADRKIIGAKTLFATHYHELTELEGKIDGVNNYCIAVKEKSDGIVFLRKIVKGGADKSYGIEVARLAGVPEVVLARAHQLVSQLSNADITAAIETITGPKPKSKPHHYDEVDLTQMSLFDTVPDEEVLKELNGLELQTLTPIEALNELYKLQNKLKNRWKSHESD
ncbi:MAG TPA: DNA mismatch repair protein MutS [Lachnospiraceae bacterium]|nr:DNA mismatch repair protein MutS [Lachnospiraceae bacterium]